MDQHNCVSYFFFFFHAVFMRSKVRPVSAVPSASAATGSSGLGSSVTAAEAGEQTETGGEK